MWLADLRSRDDHSNEIGELRTAKYQTLGSAKAKHSRNSSLRFFSICHNFMFHTTNACAIIEREIGSAAKITLYPNSRWMVSGWKLPFGLGGRINRNAVAFLCGNKTIESSCAPTRISRLQFQSRKSIAIGPPWKKTV